MIPAVLRSRAFLLLWLGQIFSQIAINMMTFVLILRAFELTSSNTAVSAIILAFSGPAAIFGLLAGVYVDRRNKKQVLVFCNLLRSLFILPLLYQPNSLSIIYITAFLVSAATQFFVPAEAPMIPKLVPKAHLLSANAVFTTSMYSSIVVGYVLAGPFLRIFGQSYIFLFLSLLFLIAGMFTSFIQVKEKGRGVVTPFANFATGRASAGSYFSAFNSDLREGYKILKGSSEVFTSLLLLSFSQVIILILGALLPGYAKGVLGIEGEDLSFFMFAPASVGMVVGAIAIGRVGVRFSPRFLINVGTLASGILIFLLPFSNRIASKSIGSIDMLYIVVFIALFLGFANSLITVSANTTLQGETHEKLHGRIYGAFISLSALLSLVPVALAGGLADIFGVGRIFWGLGIGIVFFALYRILISRYTS